MLARFKNYSDQLFLELEGLFVIFGYNSLEFVYLQILE